MLTSSAARSLAETFLRRRGSETVGDSLGLGKDGYVWRTSRRSALKIHQTRTSYSFERDYADELNALEIEIVFPPFIVDFASARLDHPPDFIEDEGNTFEDMIRERFNDRADEVLSLHQELINRADMYLVDMHAENIKFG